MPIRIIDTPFDGLVLLESKRFADDRGFFTELYKQSVFELVGLPTHFPQDNLSFSKKGVIRGLHFQKPPYGQGKLVTVLQGEALDVVVDIRRNSQTFGKVFSVILNEVNCRLMFVPEGFAHGFSVLSDTCVFHYKCTNEFNAESDGGIRWNDPALDINWKVDQPIVSAKDQLLPLFNEWQSPFP